MYIYLSTKPVTQQLPKKQINQGWEGGFEISKCYVFFWTTWTPDKEARQCQGGS